EGIRRTDAAALDEYVASLATARPDAMTPAERLAFWLNAYNALVISAIVKGVAPQEAAGRAAFFYGRKFDVAGRSRTLIDIENNVIREVFRDPRIHFALVCGSKGCPLLRPSAYAGDSLDAVLDEETRRFINDPSRVKLDRDRRVVRVSSIFQWYRKDFAGSDQALLQYLARYLPAEDQQALAGGTWRVEFIDYDWTLNGTRPRVPQADKVSSPDAWGN
ncbi:MAG: DUF547 domain-containing protein, partial [Armatimonadetes bacterium]|nr:DUF547 domain-containing protein [Armatimonadota bacterium]